MHPSGRLVQLLIDFARTLSGEYELSDVLVELCERCIEVFPASGAVVVLRADDVRVEDAGLKVAALAGGPSIEAVAQAALELREGPSFTCFRQGDDVMVPDLSEEGRERWPVFAARATDEGIRGVHSFALRAADHRVGALTLFRDEPGVLGQFDEVTGRALADVATAFLVNAQVLADADRLARQLRHALDSRVVIEQAKGVLAERLGIDTAKAFTRLRAHARASGRRIHDVAAEVVDGALTLDGD